MRIWVLYIVGVVSIAASHLMWWHSGDSLAVYVVHGVMGLVVIVVALLKMLNPVLNLFKVASTLSNITRDRSRVHQLNRELIQKGAELVRSISDLQEILKGTSASLIQEHQAILKKPLGDALADVSRQMKGAEEMTEIAKKLEAAVSDETRLLREREIETSSYVRTQAQVQMVENFWAEIHCYIFLNIGFAFLYYGIWGSLGQFALTAFRLPADASVTLSDFLYYSVVTVTTLGYGEMTPALWPTQLLVVAHLAIGVTFVVGILGVLLSLLTSEEFYQKRIFQESEQEHPDVYVGFLQEWNVRMGEKSGKLSEEFSRKLERLSKEFGEVWERHQQTLKKIGLM
ncbi:MAG: hypothetical protein GTO24_08030 [candidate division Zixibacteria bacterium]|nr:hypothetical protein [candidate division Zixibacteria bacterium]